MYSNKSKNNNSSYYFTLANELNQNVYFSQKSFNLQEQNKVNKNGERSFTFNKEFYTKNNQISAHHYKPYCSKYRSSSLPTNNDFRSSKYPYFDYYDQLIRRDYIQPKNYRSTKNLKYQYKGYDRQKDLRRKQVLQNIKKGNTSNMHPRQQLYSQSSNSIYSVNLNRFSKYDQGNKISKGVNIDKNKQALQTNFYNYNRNRNQTQHTQVNTSLYSNHQANKHNSPNKYSLYQLRSDINHKQIQLNPKKQNFVSPQIKCKVQLKADDQGRYYSTVQTDLETIVTQQKIQYDQNKNILIATTTLVRDFYQNKSLSNHQNHYENQKKPSNLKKQRIRTQNQIEQAKKQEIKKIAQKYDTFILSQKKNIPVSTVQIQKDIKLNKDKTVQQFNYTILSPKKQKNKKSLQKNKNSNKIDLLQKSKSASKTTKRKDYKKITQQTIKNAHQAGLQYYYSKYYIASLEKSKSENKIQPSSIRNEQSETIKQSPVKCVRIQKTPKQAIQVNSSKIKKTKQTQQKNIQKNYASTHLLTVKK